MRFRFLKGPRGTFLVLAQIEKWINSPNWVFRNLGLETSPAVLDYRRIYILPTKFGIVFSVILAAMLFGSTNYNNSMGFLLTFLLSGLGLVSILHTHRNLLKLEITAGKVLPIFAGDHAKFPICLSAGKYDRVMLGLQTENAAAPCISVMASAQDCAELSVPAPKRGLIKLGEFTIFTQFPLGLFRAWARLHIDAVGIVYPRPEAGLVPFPIADTGAGAGLRAGSGNEDFEGLRTYHPGDAPRHIAWKAVAREQGMLVKSFSGQAETTVWLAWDSLPQLEPEARLARLARWIIDAEQRGTSYGLRLPDKIITPAVGEIHKHRCLSALALFKNT